MCVCVYVCMCVLYVCMCVCVYCMCVLYVCTVCVYVCMCVLYVCMCVCVYVYMCVCVYVCMCVCVCVYVCMYVYAFNIAWDVCFFGKDLVPLYWRASPVALLACGSRRCCSRPALPSLVESILVDSVWIHQIQTLSVTV